MESKMEVESALARAHRVCQEAYKMTAEEYALMLEDFVQQFKQRIQNREVQMSFTNYYENPFGKKVEEPKIEFPKEAVEALKKAAAEMNLPDKDAQGPVGSATQGWQCPVCGAVLAPWVEECPHHNTGAGTIIWTTDSPFPKIIT